MMRQQTEDKNLSEFKWICIIIDCYVRMYVCMCSHVFGYILWLIQIFQQ